MLGKPLESDWKVYSKRVSEWRDRYLAEKNRQIMAVLSDAGKTPTDQFWDAKEMMENEARILEDCLGHYSRSNMLFSLMSMFHHGLVREEDLQEFSDQLRQRISAFNEMP